MKNIVLTSSVILASLSLSSVSYACDMHGGGFGSFGMRSASWEAYTPKVSTIDPALAETEMVSPVEPGSLTPPKARPSFSNVANLAAMKAKAKLANKEKPKKSDKKLEVKKKALNANR